ncbi:MAG: DUF4339 domain-containing protein [Planctomycetes bacterium]|nr:DUF4339 domain-containing protein [Planctomycetota bacterium]
MSAAQLKQLAGSGQLVPSDLVRRDDMTDWKQAGSVKGLFPTESQSTSTPPPVPEDAANKPAPPAVSTPSDSSAPSASQQSIGEKLKTVWSEFLSTAKAAKELAAAQTRKAKLTKFDLPAAYLVLGKSIFESSNFRDEFTELYEGIEKAKTEIEKFGQSASPEIEGTELKDKVRAGAASLKAKGQQKAVSMKLDSLYRDLGQKAFESRGEAAGPQEDVAPVVRRCEEVQSLDREIARLSEIGKGRLLTPKRLIIGAGVVGVLFIIVVFTSFISGNGKGASGKAMALLEAEQRQQIELTDCEPGSRADAIQALVVLSVRPAKVGGMQTVQATSPGSVKDKVKRLLASFLQHLQISCKT